LEVAGLERHRVWFQGANNWFLFDVRASPFNVMEMNNSPQTDTMTPVAKRASRSFKSFFNFWAIFGLLLTLGVARVEAQDDDYLTVYGTIEQADALNKSGKTVQAHSKYLEAKQQLKAFQQNYPTWNTSTVNFRNKYLDQQIAATLPQANVPADGSSAGAKGAASAVKLLDAGIEPRKGLRLHPTGGDKQTIHLT